MNKVFISRNESLIERLQARINDAIEIIQPLVDEFVKLNIGTLSNSDLRIIGKGKAFLQKKMASAIENPNMQGVPISRESLEASIQLPSNLSDYLSLLEDFNKCIHGNIDSPDFRVDVFQFVKLENGNIVENAVSLESFKEQHTAYAKTTREIEVANAILGIINTLNEHYEMLDEYFPTIVRRSELYNLGIKTDLDNRKFIPVPHIILGHH